ncbi:MAG: NAD(P)/FAD-dependent oxidoreductase [Myxococcaceae bacterium]
MSAKVDVAVIGGGPAGLATAIGAATRGLSVSVFDKQAWPIDKACGEGLMPSGLSALERLGALKHLDLAESAPFESITYVQEDGTRAVGALPPPGGLGVRRLALSSALRARAAEVGVKLRETTGVRGHRHVEGGVELELDSERVVAKVLVGADGLNSLTRQREGLSGPVADSRRFGLRRHVRVAPWAKTVEVHFSAGVEAYVTPAGRKRVGIAFLWEAAAAPEDVSFEALLSRFAPLKERVGAAEFDSSARGAGPLLQHVKRRAANRVALIGDAAGYVDAITGEGLTQALEGAEALAAALPEVISRDGAVEAFSAWETTMEKSFTRYARLANSVLFLARRPALRRAAVVALSKSPALFGQVLAWAL